jgi:hypothetical protein
VLALSVAGASVLGLLLKVLPWFDQNNAEIIALALPLWAGVAAGVITLERALAARPLVPVGLVPAADAGGVLVVPAAGEAPLAAAAPEGEAATPTAVGEALSGDAPIAGLPAVGDAAAGATLITGHSPDGLAPGLAPLGEGASKAPAGDPAALKTPAVEAATLKAAGKSIWGRKSPAVATVMETRAAEPKPVKWPEVTPKAPEVKALESELSVLSVLEGGPKAPLTGEADEANVAGEGLALGNVSERLEAGLPLALGNVSERLEAGLPLASELPPVDDRGLVKADEGDVAKADEGDVAKADEGSPAKADEGEKSL